MANQNPIGIIGAGAFGVVISNVAASNRDVLLYTRHKELAEKGNSDRIIRGYKLEPNVTLVNDYEQISKECDLILPIVPSTAFRKAIRTFAPYLTPKHIVIHGTKGFDVPVPYGGNWNDVELTSSQINTMSEVIKQESDVIRIGCLSGPNLSVEIRDKQPTATVVASNFEEVVKEGQDALSTDLFRIFGSSDLRGAEIAGALKNGLAIGSGILAGFGYGKNIQAILLTRGLHEMIMLGKAMGAQVNAFLGAAGIGDLIATGTSTESRNFSLGYTIGQGKTLEEATKELGVLTEGVRTLHIAKQLIRIHRLHLPIFDALYAVTVNGYPVERALKFLMNYPYSIDVDFV